MKLGVAQEVARRPCRHSGRMAIVWNVAIERSRSAATLAPIVPEADHAIDECVAVGKRPGGRAVVPD